MQMRIIRQDEELTHVALSGPGNPNQVNDIEELFLTHTASRMKPVVVDLSEVTLLLSRGMAMLTKASTLLKASGHALVVVNPSELVEEALRGVLLHRFIPIVHGIENAYDIALGRRCSMCPTD